MLAGPSRCFTSRISSSAAEPSASPSSATVALSTAEEQQIGADDRAAAASRMAGRYTSRGCTSEAVRVPREDLDGPEHAVFLVEQHDMERLDRLRSERSKVCVHVGGTTGRRARP